MRLIFATNNQHKIEEIQSAIGNSFELITLKQAGIEIDIPEPFDTLRENASEKSRVIYSLTGCDCFSEDTGLEVEVLNGAPGVKSARYSGEKGSSGENIKKLLSEIGNNVNRKARFRTVISLILNNEEFYFEGICEGIIAEKPMGHQGFGYDPIFTPLKSSKTFAEMTMEEKAIYSHRRRATDQLVSFLQKQAGKIY